MKQGIHPEYQTATVHCACGNSWETRSTKDDLHTDICSVCHPYFTGKQKLLDTAGRVERFKRKWGGQEGGKGAEAKGQAEPAAQAEGAETEAEPAEA